MPSTLSFNAEEILLHRLDMREGLNYADLGVGGAAQFLLAAAKIAGQHATVYGVDILKAALASAQARAKQAQLFNVKLVWSDLEVYGAAKEIADESIDRISMVNLLFETKQDAHVINEANRMLKTGGKCLVIDWLPEPTPFGPPLDERTSPDKVRQMARVVGWREISEFQPSPHHFGIVFEK